jgi:hypothetical protein
MAVRVHAKTSVETYSATIPNDRTAVPLEAILQPPREEEDSEESTKHQKAKSSILIISTAPRTMKHVIALWSELECFTLDVDHVVLSGPTWSTDIIQQVINLAQTSIPRFISKSVTIDATYHINDRYDVGLWCDALDAFQDESVDWSSVDQIGLLNDSVFALRPFSAIFTALRTYNTSMVSLSYSLQRPNNGYGPQNYWVESVWRGFDRTGIQTFRSYSCRPKTDPMFCSRAWWGQKGCIVENFERNMIRQFPHDKAIGLFPSDVPSNMLSRKYNFQTWVRHPPYWQKLVTEYGFPVSKVNWEDMIGSVDDDRLKPCTRYLDRTKLRHFDFSVAVKAI